MNEESYLDLFIVFVIIVEKIICTVHLTSSPLHPFISSSLHPFTPL